MSVVRDGFITGSFLEGFLSKETLITVWGCWLKKSSWSDQIVSWPYYWGMILKSRILAKGWLSIRE